MVLEIEEPIQKGGCMRHVCCALLAVVLFSSGLWAQAVSTAQITGTVKDQSGAVLPGAEVTVTQTDTGVSRNVVSDETGSYRSPRLSRFRQAQPWWKLRVPASGESSMPNTSSKCRSTGGESPTLFSWSEQPFRLHRPI